MSDLTDLYQEVILDHNRRPRNFGPLPGSNRAAKGDNPLCGDVVRLQVRVEDDAIEDVSFEGQGCAISTASASLMTEAVKGKTVAEAEVLFDRIHQLLTGKLDPGDEEAVEALGKLQVLSGVREYPMRVKCATLAWHTLHTALTDPGSTVTTEDGSD